MPVIGRLRVITLGFGAAAAVLVAGCGGGSTSANTESQEDVQAQIEQARTDAARQARLEERVKQLEAEKRQADRVRTVTQTVVVAPDDPPAPLQSPAASPVGSGYIAQLGSFTTETAAQTKAAQLRDRGLSPLVLQSSGYAQLRPGYWVVYEGFFATLAQARAAADHAKSVGVPDAFARAVSPS